jgi:molecular chaperone DnaK
LQVKEAEQYAEKDKERKEMIELRNNADVAIYSSEKSVAEYKDKLPQAVVDDINAAIAACREAQDGQDVAKLRDAVEALNQAVMKIGQSMAGNTEGSADSSSGDKQQ